MKKEVKTTTIRSLWITVFISACVFFAYYISRQYLMGESLRLDESQSLWQTSFSFNGMLTQIARDVHVPLYHSMLHFWLLFWGLGVESARSLSLLFFLLSIPALYLLTSRHFSTRIAIFSTLIFTLSAFMNWFGSEVRMYSLLVLLTILSHGIYLKLMQRGDSYTWFFYLVVSLLGVFTHYYFSLVLITQAFYFFVHPKRFPQGSFLRFALTGVVLLGFFSFWVYYFLMQGAGINTRPLLSEPSSVDLFNAITNFFLGFLNSNSLVQSFWPLTVIIIMLFISTRKKLGAVPEYFLFQVLVPILFAFLVSKLVTPIFLSRYLIIVLPALYIFINWYISCFSGKLNFFMQLAIVQLFILGLFNMILNPHMPLIEDYKGVAGYIEANAKASEVVAVSAPFTFYPISYYYRGDARITTIPYWETTRTGPIPAYSEANLIKQLQVLKRDYEAVWVVMSYDQGYEEELKTYLDNNFQINAVQLFANDIKLYKYQLKY